MSEVKLGRVTPNPLKEITYVPSFGSLLVKVTLPLYEPVASGLKLTIASTCSPGARSRGAVVLIVKAELSVAMLVMESGRAPLLVIVMIVSYELLM